MIHPAGIEVRHLGEAGLALTFERSTLWMDPPVAPEGEGLVIVTWAERERLAGMMCAEKPHPVLADPKLGAWLKTYSPRLSLLSPPYEWAGFRFETMAYSPIAYATPLEGLRKVKSALSQPRQAWDRLRFRVTMPKVSPFVVRIIISGGLTIVYLNLSLHRQTPSEWIEKLRTEWLPCDLLIAGVDFGEEQAWLDHLQTLEWGECILVDLLGDVRRRLGLPVTVLEPVAASLASMVDRRVMSLKAER